MKAAAKVIDVYVANHGSIVMVEPRSDAGKDWVSENVPLEDWQWMGPSFAVEPRMLGNLVAGMQADGLSVVGL